MSTKPKKRIELSDGQRLVDEILEDMEAADCLPTAQEKALLKIACNLVNRVQVLEDLILRDGEMIAAGNGTLKLHPAIAEQRQISATIPKVLAGIIIGDSQSTGKNPVKARAANTRWNATRNLKEVQLKAAGL